MSDFRREILDPSPTTVRSGPAGLLLAAGRGERLRPLTDRVPKPAVPLPGAPLGAWMLERLLEHCSAVTVNCSHLATHVISRLGLEGRAAVLDEGAEPFGTAGTIAAVRDEITDRVVVANADVITDLELASVLAQHEESGAWATVVVVPVSSGADFRLAADGTVAGFVDRRTRSEPGVLFMGISVFEREALDRLPDVRPLGLGESLLGSLAAEGVLAAHVHEGYYCDVGTIARYAQVCRDVLSGIAPGPPDGPYDAYRGRIVEVGNGRAFVSDSARCDKGSLGPGAVILAASVVEPGALVRDAIVWERETVPAGTVLDGALLFGGETLTLK